MQEKTSFWQRYGLMILTIILYGLDLGVILFVSQRLYKNIVEVTTFAALPPVFFVLWLLRGKAGKENYRRDCTTDVCSTIGIRGATVTP